MLSSGFRSRADLLLGVLVLSAVVFLLARPAAAGVLLAATGNDLPPAAVRDLVARQSDVSTDVTLIWRPPDDGPGVGGVVASYFLTARFAAESRQLEVFPAQACTRRGLETVCTASWENADPGERSFGVRARNAHGLGPASVFAITVSVVAPPAGVRGLAAHPDGQAGAVTVTWRSLLDDDGRFPVVDAYYLRRDRAVPEVLEPGVCAASGGVLYCTVTRSGLPFGEHTWSVWSANAAGSGPRASVTFDLPPPFTAEVTGVPPSHDGGRFSVRLTFSEKVAVGYRDLRDHAFVVAGGRVDRARRVRRGSSLRWHIRVRPNAGEIFAATLPGRRPCADPGAVCTAAGRMLHAAVTFSVPPE